VTDEPLVRPERPQLKIINKKTSNYRKKKILGYSKKKDPGKI
jgi:hypothetical protein